MTPLDLLKDTQQSEEVRRSISTAGLLWAISSLVAVVLKQFGLVANYEDALPVVILVSYMGAEIAARLPNRTPIAICANCSQIQTLPILPFRRFWPWRHCTKCGGPLRYTCPNKHLLSIFGNEELVKDKAQLWCSRCGKLPRLLSETEFVERLRFTVDQKPIEVSTDKDYSFLVANIILNLIQGTTLENILQEPIEIFKKGVVEERKRNARRRNRFEIDV